jgi:hypothetical protein
MRVGRFCHHTSQSTFAVSTSSVFDMEFFLFLSFFFFLVLPSSSTLTFPSSSLSHSFPPPRRRVSSPSFSPLPFHLLSLRGGMQLTVKTMSGNTLSVDINPNDTIEELKEKIEKKEGFLAVFPL